MQYSWNISVSSDVEEEEDPVIFGDAGMWKFYCKGNDAESRWFILVKSVREHLPSFWDDVNEVEQDTDDLKYADWGGSMFDKTARLYFSKVYNENVIRL
jgi:hypothetical protein